MVQSMFNTSWQKRLNAKKIIAFCNKFNKINNTGARIIGSIYQYDDN